MPDAASAFSKKQLSHYYRGNEEFGCSRFASLKVENGQLVGDLASTFEVESQELLTRFERPGWRSHPASHDQEASGSGETLGHLRIEVAKALDLVIRVCFISSGLWIGRCWSGMKAKTAIKLCTILSHGIFEDGRNQVNSVATPMTSS